MLIGPNVEEDIHANFQCKVVYGSDDPEQIFEIVWTINGQLDASLPSQLLFAQERTTILNITSLNNHVDTNVSNVLMQSSFFLNFFVIISQH